MNGKLNIELFFIMEQKNKENLVKFLQKAKRKTFASKISIPSLNMDGSKQYVYREGDWLYQDKYFGSLIDTGQEVVFHKGRLIWSMSYRGGMLEDYKDLSRKCFSFLKKCLREAPVDFPVRGPQKYEEKDFLYENNWRGNLEDFVGEEKIFLGGNQIYFRNYLGGTGEPKKELF
jgi:hypothetical protein